MRAVKVEKMTGRRREDNVRVQERISMSGEGVGVMQ